MPVTCTCAQCGKSFAVRDTLVGKRIRCPNCQGIIDVAGKGKTGLQRPPSGRHPSTRQPKRTTTMKRSERKEPQGKQPQRTTTVRMPRGKASTGSTTVRSAGPGKSGDTREELEADAGTTVLCPSCGKAIRESLRTCPYCKHNLRLGRKLNLGGAIQEAEMHQRGLYIDGTRKITRQDEVRARVKRSGNVARKMQILAAVFVVFCLVSFVVLMYYFASKPATMEALIESYGLPRIVWEDPDTYHPFHVRSEVEVAVPLNFIFFQKIKPPEGDSGMEKAAHLAESLRLPYIVPRDEFRFIRYHVRPIMVEVEKLGGHFTPEALEQGLSVRRVAIWRQTEDLRAFGSLTGALLDFEDYQPRLERLAKAVKAFRQSRGMRPLSALDDIVVPLEKRGEIDAKVLITAKLSYIPVRQEYLRGGIASWADALRNYSPRVIRPGAGTVKDPKVDETPPAKGYHYYFCPVLKVKKMRLGDSTLNVERPAPQPYRPENGPPPEDLKPPPEGTPGYSGPPEVQPMPPRYSTEEP